MKMFHISRVFHPEDAVQRRDSMPLKPFMLFLLFQELTSFPKPPRTHSHTKNVKKCNHEYLQRGGGVHIFKKIFLQLYMAFLDTVARIKDWSFPSTTPADDFQLFKYCKVFIYSECPGFLLTHTRNNSSLWLVYFRWEFPNFPRPGARG